jgi:hypothetical protein
MELKKKFNTHKFFNEASIETWLADSDEEHSMNQRDLKKYINHQLATMRLELSKKVRVKLFAFYQLDEEDFNSARDNQWQEKVKTVYTTEGVDGTKPLCNQIAKKVSHFINSTEVKYRLL